MVKLKKDTPKKLPRCGVLVVPPQMSVDEWLEFVEERQSQKNTQAKPSLKQQIEKLNSIIDGVNAMAKELVRRNENAPAGSKTYTEKQIVRDYWHRLYNKARSIFKEAANVGINLPPVPAGGDTLKDFQSLQGWADEALQIVKKGSGNGKQENLTDTEQDIIEALGDKTMKGQELLKNAGYDYSSHYKTILSNLVKRGILENIHNKGYKRK